MFFTQFFTRETKQSSYIIIIMDIMVVEYFRLDTKCARCLFHLVSSGHVVSNISLFPCAANSGH